MAQRRTTAICVTGELRTFGAPLVHHGLLAFAEWWRGDLLFFTRSSRPCHVKVLEHSHAGQQSSKQSVTNCEDSASVIERLIASANPGQLVSWHNASMACATSTCVRTVGAQWTAIHECLVHAVARPHYRTFVRVRPDFFFLPTALPAPPPTHPARATRADTMSSWEARVETPELAVPFDTNADLFFSMNRAATLVFLELGWPLQPPKCGSASKPGSSGARSLRWPVTREAECCLDRMHPLLALAALHATGGARSACRDAEVRKGVPSPWARIVAMASFKAAEGKPLEAASLRRLTLPPRAAPVPNATCRSWLEEDVRLVAVTDLVGGLLRTPQDLRVRGGTNGEAGLPPEARAAVGAKMRRIARFLNSSDILAGDRATMSSSCAVSSPGTVISSTAASEKDRGSSILIY